MATVSLGAIWASLQFGSAHAQSLSTATEGNSDRLRVTPSVRASYDSNVLRFNDSVTDPSDNVRATAGIDVILNRIFGRTSVNLTGTVGYDFNSRFKFLDRTRIEIEGGIRTPVGAICSLALTARYQQFQFDLGDVDQIVAATDRQQNYDALASCNRAAGFSPLAGVSYGRRDSGSALFSGSETVSVRGGVSYAKPSLGTVSLIASRVRITRPDFAGAPDGTDITQLQASLARNVAPRFGFNIGLGYVRAQPDRAIVGSFSGLSYNGEVTWRPTPRFVATASAGRDVNSQSGINSTYVIRDDYRASLSLRLTQRSRVRFTAMRIDRDFRGRQPLPGAVLIEKDKTDIVGTSYSYDTSRLFRITASASQRWRRADPSVYDYKSTVFTLGVGARF